MTVRLSQLRERLADEAEMLSQSEVARKYRIPVSQVCEIISGKRPVTATVANAMGWIVDEPIVRPMFGQNFIPSAENSHV
ncbi:helix-turn-helix domain-containing protein [Acetobacter sp. UBA5411]|uniref:helix-turn-helix domain-containing protein n=1 Tax=Acetobacter sp. UBA5411 TaxID=1945905 RepID=UPI0025C5FA4C|nr:helix-turn-helix transcriptional regulator [Acetobacter sp. UBA5411]